MAAVRPGLVERQGAFFEQLHHEGPRHVEHVRRPHVRLGLHASLIGDARKPSGRRVRNPAPQLLRSLGRRLGSGPASPSRVEVPAKEATRIQDNIRELHAKGVLGYNREYVCVRGIEEIAKLIDS